ncbi:hypothetical protein JCM6882_007213 [Rhodosporidiobolus microsporus]
MCISTVAAGYGLFVRTASLVAAVDAYKPLQGPLAFFKLLSLRQRKNTLRFTSCLTCAFSRVPGEIWAIVREEVIATEVDAAAEKLFKETVLLAGHGNTSLASGTFEERWATAINDACLGCGLEAIYAWQDVFSGKRLKTAQRLLQSYGLSLPSDNMVRPAHEFPDERVAPSDFLSASFVTLRLSRMYGNTPSRVISAEVSPEELGEPASDAVMDVAFDLPANPERRFSRFIRDYGIEVVRVTEDEVSAEGGVKGGEPREISSSQLCDEELVWRVFATSEWAPF